MSVCKESKEGGKGKGRENRLAIILSFDWEPNIKLTKNLLPFSRFG